MDNLRKVFIAAAILMLLTYAFITNKVLVERTAKEREEAIKQKQEEFDITNDVTSINTYSMKSVEPEEMSKIYFNDYKNMIVSFPDEAYDLIINKEEISKTEFLEYRDLIINDYYNYNYATYQYYQELTSNCYVYRVTNNQGETFTFKTHSVMNYEINITL